MAEIFVSYARSNAKEAQAVAGGLRDVGWEVWVDNDLPAHRAFTEVIEEKLQAAAAVVVVWSAEAAKSEWVQAEADMARAARKLVQLTVDGARLPLPFDRVQCADLTGWTGDPDAPGWRKVLTSVRDLVGAPVSAPHAASHSAARAAEPLLAVLAFDNLSGDAEMAYFSDGVSEEILQTVARGAELKVLGRGSSFQFRGAGKAAANVARALRATHVLDGSVRRSGSKVRIAANLIECAGETTLWSDRFDRELSDVFALQDEIAAAVAAALKVTFAPAVQAETVDPAAYTLYLKARELRNRGLLSPETVVAVIRLLDEATTLAPRFARAWEFLATMQVEHLRFAEVGQSLGVERADVVAAAETALELDPGLGAAYQALGQLEPFGRFADREAFHVKALSVAPNDPTVLTNASLFFAEVGRIRDALEYARRAYGLDPMYPWAACWYAVTVEYAGREAACRDLWRRFTAQWPDNELIAWGAVCAAYDYRDWDWFDDLVAAAREKQFASPTLQSSIAGGGRLRAPTAAVQQRELKRARERLAKDGVLPVWVFKTLYDLGLADETFELVGQASFAYMFDPDLGSPNGAVGSSLIFDGNSNLPMMRDIRFVGLCAKLGLCDYWVRTGRWPDCAEAVAADYDFKAEARRLAS
ncbi:MAG TPA: TIR domain-containing protein [Caulobacteraceae bacterium]|nr:TIR domain-containing protein [Caulobacteraceae bacterium]